jgi:nitrite reductase/ring-hydroxylating ferredoxin subunit/uncharacterized membrane protein
MPAANRLARFLDSLSSRIEDADVLDRIAEPVSSAAGRVRDPRWLVDLLSGTPIGHPVHPLLVTVPIGSWTSAMVLDCFRQPEAARTLIGFGAVGALPAALSGLNDWRDTTGAERRVGIVHATLNSTALTLYVASWLARRRGRHGLGVALSIPPTMLVATAGWLGGHLSYARGVGVDTTAFQGGSEEWVDALSAADVQSGMLSVVDVAGVPVFVTRTTGGTLVAYADRCTHRGGPLHEGELVDGCVRCPWHGSEFSLEDGSVRHGPATRPQPSYDIRVADDRILVRRAATKPAALR